MTSTPISPCTIFDICSESRGDTSRNDDCQTDQSCWTQQPTRAAVDVRELIYESLCEVDHFMERATRVFVSR